MRLGKKGRGITAALCALAMFTCALSGCGQKGSGSVNEQTTGGNEKPVKIRIMNRLNAEIDVENNPILEELEKRLNMEIEYEAPPINNYGEKLQITMASGELPDIIYYQKVAGDNDFENWSEDGLFAELDDRIADYPNIMATVPDNYWNAVRSIKTGKIQAVPRPNVTNYNGYLINQEWLNNLGLEAPVTLEEFKNVCHAFTYDDPDQNGKDDTFGLSCVSLYPPFLKNAFGLADVKDTNGEYATITKRTGYLPCLNYMRDLYKDGALDPEFFTNEVYSDEEKIMGGRAGIIGNHQAKIMGMSATVPDVVDRLTYCGALEDLNGVRSVYLTPAIWGCWMISADADVDAALRLIDYCMSEEGFILMFLGIEGENYNSYDFERRKVERTEEQSEAIKYMTSTYFTFSLVKDGGSAIIENADTQKKLDKYYSDFNAMKEVTTPINVPEPKLEEENDFKMNNPELVTKLSEMEIKFVVGEIEENEFVEFLTDEYWPAHEEAEKAYVTYMKSME